MAISISKPSISLEDVLSRRTELDILHHYFGIDRIPCIIPSPLRVDKHPSFGLYSLDGVKIHWIDLANRDRGGLFDLLGRYWGESYSNVLARVWEDSSNITPTSSYNKLGEPRIVTTRESVSSVELECKVREWRGYDIEYWGNYGISPEWLKFADIYPVSHKIITKNGRRMVFPADKYAYTYVEFKEGKVTHKIYQPFNKQGYKWSNNHDRSVISLWTKVPMYGERICICASMKDALCLWACTGIPSIAIQGEGYGLSDTAANELRRRYKHVFILLDNDKTGLIDGEKLAQATGFTNLVLPSFGGGKDTSDLRKYLGNNKSFNQVILPLFEGGEGPQINKS